MNKRRPGGMGASSILMIFVVLALTSRSRKRPAGG